MPVTAHVFGADALPGLIHAGIDGLHRARHRLTDELIGEMARRGTALVPTLINIDTFPGIAERAERFPRNAAHMRALHARAHGVVRRAVGAGVPVFAGTTPVGESVTGGSRTRSLPCTPQGSPPWTHSARRAGRRGSGWPARAGFACRPIWSSIGTTCATDPAVLSRPALVLLRGRVVDRRS